MSRALTILGVCGLALLGCSDRPTGAVPREFVQDDAVIRNAKVTIGGTEAGTGPVIWELGEMVTVQFSAEQRDENARSSSASRVKRKTITQEVLLEVLRQDEQRSLVYSAPLGATYTPPAQGEFGTLEFRPGHPILSASFDPETYEVVLTTVTPRASTEANKRLLLWKGNVEVRDAFSPQ